MIYLTKNYLVNLFFLILILVFLSSCLSSVKSRNEKLLISTYQSMAAEYMAQGKIRPALKKLFFIRKKDPYNVKTLNLLGLAYLGLGRVKSAKKLFKKVIKIDSKFYTAYLNMAACSLELRQYEETIRILKKIPEESYESPEKIHGNIGLAYLNLKKYEYAVLHFNKALSHNPLFYPAYLHYGDVRLKQKRYKEAIKLFKTASNHCKTCVIPLYNLGYVYKKMGKMKKSLSYLDKVISMGGNKLYAKKARNLKKGLVWK